MTDELKTFINDNIELINQNTTESWEEIYSKIPETIISEFTNTILSSGINDPAVILGYIPKRYLYRSKIQEYVIPDSVKSIGEDAFNTCSSLTSVKIGKGVTEIGSFAFAECESLTSIEIPDNLTEIGDNAFYWCTSLKSVIIPDSVTTIGYNAFYYCRSLTSVIIGDGVISIDDDAFHGCNSLTNVVIGDRVISIGDAAFAWCENLKEIQFKCTKKDAITRLKVRNESWRKLSSIKKIICTDGEIIL